MRHIPEEELHAYLDQALSRSQCVEIERHLTRCPRCRVAREEIAVVRDRTTDLLARLGPPWFLSPPFEQIRQQSRLRQRRRRHVTASLLAAGLAVAVLLQARPALPASGLAAGSGPSPSTSGPIQVPVREAPERTRPEPAAPARPTSGTPASEEAEPPVAASADPVTAPPAEAVALPGPPDAATLTAVTFENPGEASDPGSARLFNFAEIEAQPVDPVPTLPGLWLTVGSEDGRIAAPADAARIPGLPVVRVRVQPGGPGEEVVAVDQLLENGEVVRTLSGPPERVHAALAGDGEFRDPADGGRLTVTIRQDDRMVAVTGPSEVLGALFPASTLRRRY